MQTLIILFVSIITAIRLSARIYYRIRKKEFYPRRVLYTEKEDLILALLNFVFLVVLIGSLYL